MKQPAQFDLKRAVDRVGGDCEMLGQLARLFLADYPIQLANIHQAIRTRDIWQLQLVTSGLKGALSIFWAEDAYDLVVVLDHLASSEAIDKAAKVAGHLEAALERFRGELIFVAEDLHFLPHGRASSA